MKYTKRPVSTRESGMALVFAIGLLALLLMIGMAFIGNAVNYRKVAENNSARSQSRMFALSAVSRAATSLMIYAHQYARVPEKNNEFPQSFDGIYSYAAYNNAGEPADGGTEYNDGLLGDASLMRVPSSSSVIGARTAMKFNQQFARDWPGKWVFFSNGQSGTSRRIIGRAAWQVIGSPAQLMAPVFMRGHIAGLDADPDVVPQEERWGREIDEVYLGELDGGSWTAINEVFSGVYPKLKAPTDTLFDYDPLYSTAGTKSGDSEVQRWLERWFIPELEEGKKIADPSRIAAEAYSDGGDSLARFNISELGNGKDWQEAYDVHDNADPWYARFGIDSTAAGESAKLNSEESIKLLSQDSLPYSSENEDDSSYAVDGDTTGLPFLRRIGDSAGTFSTLAALRKQIAANFNDYSDADGMPTSDVSAVNWLKSLDDAANPYTHPSYTGNEKTPYIYELGMNFGLVSSDSAVNPVRAVKDASSGRYRIGIAVKAAPIMKLVNIYPFDPAEAVKGKALYEKFADNGFMRGYVDFGKVDFDFDIREVLFNNIVFTYDVTTQKYEEVVDGEGNKSWKKVGDPETVSKQFTLDTATLKKDFLDVWGGFAGPDTSSPLKFKFASGSWRRGVVGPDGATAIEPVIFSEDDLKNTDGTKPYPAKKSSSKDDKLWQIAPSKDTQSMEFALTIANSDFFVQSGTSGSDTATAVDKDAANVVWGNKVTDSGEGTMDEFRYAFGERKTSEINGAEKIETTYGNAVIGAPESVDVEEIELTSLQIGDFRRAVLTANIPVGSASAVEAGVDYVKEFPAFDQTAVNDEFLTLNKVMKLNPGTEATPNNVPGLVIGAYRNLDPRQNLNAGDWVAVTAVKRVENFIAPEESVVASVMKIDGSGTGLVNTPVVADSNIWIPKNYDDAEGTGVDARSNMDWERAGEPAYVGPEQEKHISTAVIRNAPMMSPWEIGFIHRGTKWQTINLKKAEFRNFSDNEDAWGNNGSSYANGDAAILEQIKMTDKSATYGKINVNMLSPRYANFSTYDYAIIQALFQNLRYNEEPAVFIKNSTRKSDGTFADPEESGTLIDKDYFDKSSSIGESIIENMTRDGSRQHNGKLAFLNYEDVVGDISYALGNAFCDFIWKRQLTDAAQEEIIGKTINLINATVSTPSVINMVVIAQSIRDNGGEQIRMTDETSGFTNLNGATIDSDGLASKSCEFGKFDFVEHDSDNGKNIYFDDITGEVKMYVRLYITDKGRMIINRVHYF